jgi:hypothetical protein
MNKQDYADRVAAARLSAAQSPTEETRCQLAAALAAYGMYAVTAEHDYLEAILLQEEAISVYDAVGDEGGKAAVYFNLCRIYELGLHKNEIAYTYARKALESVQDRRLHSMYEVEFDCLVVAGLREGWIHPRPIRI